jgi:hypothetical protein
MALQRQRKRRNGGGNHQRKSISKKQAGGISGVSMAKSRNGEMAASTMRKRGSIENIENVMALAACAAMRRK